MSREIRVFTHALPYDFDAVDRSYLSKTAFDLGLGVCAVPHFEGKQIHYQVQLWIDGAHVVSAWGLDLTRALQQLAKYHKQGIKNEPSI